MTTTNKKFDTTVSDAKRKMRQSESILIEGLDVLKNRLDTVDYVRDLTAKIKVKLDAIDRQAQINTNDPAKKAIAKNNLAIVTRKYNEAIKSLDITKNRFKQGWNLFRMHLQKYQIIRKGLFESIETGIEAIERYDEIQEHNANVALTNTIGQVLLAWKTSNAFDDLAKLSGRK